jgi:hypothetical protein
MQIFTFHDAASHRLCSYYASVTSYSIIIRRMGEWLLLLQLVAGGGAGWLAGCGGWSGCWLLMRQADEATDECAKPARESQEAG